MAVLNFEKIINLTEAPNNIKPLLVRDLCMANEPDNELVQYYIDTNSLAEDKAAKVSYNNYGTLAWGNKQKRLTTRNVSDIGIKSFPGVGAVAFFKYKYGGNSYVLCPVNNRGEQREAPTLTMVVSETSLTFTIQAPEEVVYECYRIVLRNKHFAVEYITYETTLVVPKPSTTGTYDIYCIGYIKEGEAISEDSNHYELYIEGTLDSWPGPEEITDVYVTGVKLSADNKIILVRSDGEQVISENAIATTDSIVPVSATFSEDGYLTIVLSNNTSIKTDNTIPVDTYVQRIRELESNLATTEEELAEAESTLAEAEKMIDDINGEVV